MSINGRLECARIPIISDFIESACMDVLKKPVDKRRDIQRDDAFVAYGHTVRLPGKILQYTIRGFATVFCKNDPILLNRCHLPISASEALMPTKSLSWPKITDFQSSNDPSPWTEWTFSGASCYISFPIALSRYAVMASTTTTRSSETVHSDLCL